MEPSLFIYNSIRSSSYPKVRLRHIKYINQLSLPNSILFSTNIKHITFKKLKQLKKLSLLILGRGPKPLLVNKHQKQFLHNIFQSLKCITNSSLLADHNVQQLKNLRVLKSVSFSQASYPRCLLFLRKLQEISFRYEPSESSPPRKRLFILFAKIFKTLPCLRKVMYDGPHDQLPETLKTMMATCNLPLRYFLFSLKGSRQFNELSLGPLQNITTMFSTQISSRKAFSIQLMSINSMKNLLSLSLNIFVENIAECNLEALRQVGDLPYLQNFHLVSTSSLEHYVSYLGFPKSLNTLILQLREFPTVNASSDLEVIRKAYMTLIDKISKLQYLKILQLEIRPTHDGYHIVFQEVLQIMLQNMPASIEDFGVVEWYHIARTSTVNLDKVLLPYEEVVRHLSKAKCLEKLSLYMNISTCSIDQRFSLNNLVDLFLTINTEECKINDILCSLNPERIKYITILNRGAGPGLIKETEFSKFMGNLADFQLLKDMRFTGFFLDGSDDNALDDIRDTLLVLDELTALDIDMNIEKRESQNGIDNLKALILAKKKLQSCKLKFRTVVEPGRDFDELIELRLERSDVGTRTEGF